MHTKYELPVCLSRAWVNWFRGGGTFSRWNNTAFCLWSLIYRGHLTNLLKSLFGWISWPDNKNKTWIRLQPRRDEIIKGIKYNMNKYTPMPKFFVRFSNRGLTTLLVSTFLVAKGAAATFFFPFLPLGWKFKAHGWHLKIEAEFCLARQSENRVCPA